MAETDRRWRREAWFWFIASITIAIATPFLAQMWIENHWAGVSSLVLNITVYNWIEIYILSAIATFVFYESAHLYTLRASEEAEVPRFIMEIVTELAEKAGIETPVVIYNPRGKPRFAASKSFFSGGRIYIFGDIRPFTYKQIRSIIAHEMGHLMMSDGRVKLVKHVILGGLRVLALVQFAIMIAALAIAFLNLFPWVIGTYLLVLPIVYALLTRTDDSIIGAIVAGLLLIAKLMSPEVTAPMVFAFTTSLVGTVLTVLTSHAFSRVIEYRTDAIGVDLTDAEYAIHLAAALDKFYHILNNTKRKKQRYRDASVLLMAHPKVVDRKLALFRRYVEERARNMLHHFKLG